MPAGDDSDDVLSRLPKTRPARRSTRRASADAATPKASETAKAAPKPKARAKPKAAPKPKAAAKPRAAPKPKAARTTPPPEPTPEPVRRPIEPPSGSEILQTAVQAASDIAQVGLVIGREALKAARSKLPGGK